MKKKSIILILTLALMACFAIGVSACGKNPDADCAHSETAIIGEAKAATCTEEGISAGSKCLNCGEVLEAQATIPATGHNFVATEEYDGDATHHWIVKKCSKCQAVATPTDEDKTLHSGETATCQNKAVCSVCEKEYGEIGDHDFTGDYLTDENNHWKKCANCSATSNLAGHVGGQATCVKKAKCTECNAEYGEFVAHTMDTEWSKDENNHWKKCKEEGCNYIESKSEHSGGTADCTTKPTCETCGISYGEALGHNVDTEWSKDENNHWNKCLNSGCNYMENNEAHKGGNADCENQARCEVCNRAYGTALGHDFTGEYNYNAQGHWKKCARPNCESEDIANIVEHSGGEATCTDKAICIACNQEYGSALGHDMDTNWSKDQNNHWHKCLVEDCEYVEDQEAHKGGVATCQAKAECEVCNKEYGQFAGHNYGSSWEYKESDGHAKVCQTEGCGKLEEKISHTPDRENADETNPVKCTECDYIITPATGHVTHTPNTSEWKWDTTHHYRPCTGCTTYTESSKGEHVYDDDCDTSCNTCSYNRTVTHDFTATGYDGSDHWIKCRLCELEQENSREQHTGGTATCTTQKQCTTCNQNYGVVLGHNFTKVEKNTTEHWVVCNREGCTVEQENSREEHKGGTATCTTQAKCSVCETSYGNLLDHDYSGDYLSNEEGHWKKCKNCSSTTTIEEHEGGEATCTTQKQCTVCQKSYGETLGHDFTKLEKNATHHYYLCSRAGCGAEQPNSRVEHSGGTATCTEKAVCKDCDAPYGELLEHNYTSLQKSVDEHWYICTACSGEQPNSRVEHSGGTATCTEKAVCKDCGVSYGELLDHNYTSLQKSVDEHWYICTACSDEQPNSRANHSGGKATYASKAKCSTCQTEYGSILIPKAYLVGSFDNEASKSVAGEREGNHYMWAKNIDYSVKHSGEASLKVVPHSTDGTWQLIEFNYGGNYKWNLETAHSIVLWAYTNSANAISGFSFYIQDDNKNQAWSRITIPSKSWVKFEIDLVAARNEGVVDLSSVYICLSQEASTYSNRDPFYLDEFVIYDVEGSRYGTPKYLYEVATFDRTEDVIQAVTDNTACWPVLISSEKSYDGGDSLKVNVHQEWGSYMSITFRRNGKTAFDLTDTESVSIMALSSGDRNTETSTSIDNLRFELIDKNGMTYVLTGFKVLSTGWSRIQINTSTVRTSKPDFDLSSVTIKFAISCDYAEYVNRSTFYLDELCINGCAKEGSPVGANYVQDYAYTDVNEVLHIRYQDTYVFSNTINDITDVVITSNVAGTNNKDATLLKKVNDNTIYAVGVGSATVKTANGDIKVIVEPSPINVFFVTGQSNGGGDWCYEYPELYENYSKYFMRTAPTMAYYTQAGAGELTVANASEFVASTLNWEAEEAGRTNARGCDLTVLSQADTDFGYAGWSAALANEWVARTGERVWMVNASHGGKSIAHFVPSSDGTPVENEYYQAIGVFNEVLNTLYREVSAGHFTLNHFGYFWFQGEGDTSGTDENYYRSQFEKVHNGFMKDVKYSYGGVTKELEFGGLMTIRSVFDCTGNADSELVMTGARVAQYEMASQNTGSVSNVFVATNVTEKWLSGKGTYHSYYDDAHHYAQEWNAEVANYFINKYGSAEHFKSIFGYDMPTMQWEISPTIHFTIQAQNEMGIDAAQGLLMRYNLLAGQDIYNIPYDCTPQVSLVERDGLTNIAYDGTITIDLDKKYTILYPKVSPVAWTSTGVEMRTSTAGFTFDGFKLRCTDTTKTAVSIEIYVNGTHMTTYNLNVNYGSVLIDNLPQITATPQSDGSNVYTLDNPSYAGNKWRMGYLNTSSGVFTPYTSINSYGWLNDGVTDVWSGNGGMFAISCWSYGSTSKANHYTSIAWTATENRTVGIAIDVLNNSSTADSSFAIYKGTNRVYGMYTVSPNTVGAPSGQRYGLNGALSSFSINVNAGETLYFVVTGSSSTAVYPRIIYK